MGISMHAVLSKLQTQNIYVRKAIPYVQSAPVKTVYIYLLTKGLFTYKV